MASESRHGQVAFSWGPTPINASPRGTNYELSVFSTAGLNGPDAMQEARLPRATFARYYKIKTSFAKEKVHI